MKIVILIVTYNAMPWIDCCMRSISDKYDVVIVDNNSQDETVKHLEDCYPKATVLLQKNNLGFGMGNNVGLRYIRPLDYQGVFLLNQDAYLNSNTIVECVKAYEVNEEVAIVSPVQFQNDNRTLDTRFVYHVTEAGIETSQLFNEPFKEVLFINAAAWLLPMSTLEVIGGFDPLFQHYGEDDNYCHRVLYHHKKIILATQSHFIHDRNNNIPSEPKIYSSIWWKLKERRFKVMYANPLKFEKPILDYYGTVLKKLSMGKINNVLQVLKLRSKQRDWFKACQLSKQITQTKGPHYL
ncbi:glycosyltransferase [Nonlabens sp. Ci31]|uniref:glycosyltransferase family 2 protein n=1 Tax=Nonlabens sp. Ci31 TaxID=2608253 RepID=UPI0014635DF2|nr:glycosyltransferase [Nonlabens sp. Ci31]QJP32997.1 glycosyltransferase [Nonlabens sp. Ci31]